MRLSSTLRPCAILLPFLLTATGCDPNESPTLSITEPVASGVFYSDMPVELSSTAADAEDAAEDLRVSWSTADGVALASDLVPDAAGVSTSSATLAEGTHTLTATVEDTAEATGSASVTIVVGPPSSPPACALTSPEDGAAHPLGQEVVIAGTATDVDVPAESLLVTFSSSLDGPLGDATPDGAGAVSIATSSLTTGTHTLTLTATDEVGLSCVAEGTLSVSTPPTAQVVAPAATDLLSDNVVVEFSGLVGDAEDAPTNLSVAWSSDVDGALGETAADEGGEVALSVATLSAGTHLITLTATDSVGLTGTDTVTLEVNASPTAPVVSITPEAPVTTDDLTVAIDTPSTDPDGGPSSLSYTYTWSLDGAPASDFDGMTSIPAAETATGQSWSVSVVATDGQATSEAGVAAVGVGNSLPTLAGATVSPSVGLATTVFTVTPSGWADADGDPEGYQYQWYADAAPAAGATGSSWAPTGQPAGTEIWCEVTPFDGVSVGLPVASNMAAVNTPPSVSGVVISPATATETTVLSASFGSIADVDGQSVSVSWQWSVNGTPVTGATGTAIDGTSFDKGQTVTVTCTPNDGIEDGTPTTSTGVLVDNTPPSITSVSISPTSGGENATFTCTPAGWSDIDPADTTPAYMWQWTVAGANSVTTQTITGANFDLGDDIACTATPTDGTTLGTPVTSSPVTVENTAPSITGVSISPTSGGENTTFTCTPSGWSDPDGDAPGYTWQWTVDGATSVTTQTITGASFDAGQVIACEATPTDGIDPGTSLMSSPVTIENTPPSITGVSIVPGSGGEATAFSCAPTGWSDIDGDAPGYTWQWTVNGAPSVASQTITGASFDKGQSIACTATPTDGTTPGTPLTSSAVVIDNTPPSLTSVSISPPSGGENTTFVCAPGGWSDIDPADATPTYIWQWTVDGAASVTTRTITGASFDAGESIACTATPTDGTATGTPLTSPPVTIDNAPPNTGDDDDSAAGDDDDSAAGDDDDSAAGDDDDSAGPPVAGTWIIGVEFASPGGTFQNCDNVYDVYPAGDVEPVPPGCSLCDFSTLVTFVTVVENCPYDYSVGSADGAVIAVGVDIVGNVLYQNFLEGSGWVVGIPGTATGTASSGSYTGGLYYDNNGSFYCLDIDGDGSCDPNSNHAFYQDWFVYW